jgi:hypothetical protein
MAFKRPKSREIGKTSLKVSNVRLYLIITIKI